MRVVLLHQFLFLENIVDMLPYSLLVTVKQRGHLVNTEPYRLVLQLHIKLYAPVLRAVYLYAFCSFSMVSSYYITLLSHFQYNLVSGFHLCRYISLIIMPFMIVDIV